jgi:hypothetical protein
MLSAAPLHRRLAPLAPLAGVSIALVSACLLPAAAGAAGFSGSFNPANWSIVNVGGGLDQTLSGSGTPPGYTCVGNQVACAEQVDANTGAVDVVGSVVNLPGGGTSTTARTTTWTVTNGAQISDLSFNWRLTTYGSGASNQRVSYLIGGIETPLGSSDGNNGSVTNIALAAGQTFGFRVSTIDNTGDYGVLSITGFDAAIRVPAPLPMAGGIAAFSWSRRLRSRIRQPNS